MIKVADLTRYNLHEREVVLQETQDKAVKLVLATNILTREVKFHVIDEVDIMSFDSLDESIVQFNKLAF
jgi:hypothetical protein